MMFIACTLTVTGESSYYCCCLGTICYLVVSYDYHEGPPSSFLLVKTLFLARFSKFDQPISLL